MLVADVRMMLALRQCAPSVCRLMRHLGVTTADRPQRFQNEVKLKWKRCHCLKETGRYRMYCANYTLFSLRCLYKLLHMCTHSTCKSTERQDTDRHALCPCRVQTLASPYQANNNRTC